MFEVKVRSKNQKKLHKLDNVDIDYYYSLPSIRIRSIDKEVNNRLLTAEEVLIHIDFSDRRKMHDTLRRF